MTRTSLQRRLPSRLCGRPICGGGIDVLPHRLAAEWADLGHDNRSHLHGLRLAQLA